MVFSVFPPPRTAPPGEASHALGQHLPVVVVAQLQKSWVLALLVQQLVDFFRRVLPVEMKQIQVGQAADGPALQNLHPVGF